MQKIQSKTGMIILCSFTAAITAAVTCIFLFQERCQVASRKVIAYGVTTAIAFALLIGAFLLFYSKCLTHKKDIETSPAAIKWKKDRIKLSFLIPLLVALGVSVIEYLVITGIVDQNHNYLWIIINNYGAVNIPGIISLALTLFGIFGSGAWAFSSVYK